MSKIENKHIWGIRTAARLRAVHASFPDLGPEERGGYLVDELEYALEEASSLAGENRNSLLETLEAYFPVYGQDTAPAPLAPAAALPPAATHELSVGDMIDALCAKSQDLTPAQMQQLSDLVAASGKPCPGSNAVAKPLADKLALPATPAELDDFLKSINQLWVEMGGSAGEQTPFKLNRLLKMLGMLTANFRDIYRFIWPFWREMAPRELNAQIQPAFPDGLEAAIASYTTGGQVGGGEFYTELETTKKILLSILFGLRKGAEEYGKLYERKFSSEAIADTVALEESASDVSKVRDLGRKCWDKYSQLTKHHTADAIHDDIVKAMAEAAFTKLKLSS